MAHVACESLEPARQIHTFKSSANSSPPDYRDDVRRVELAFLNSHFASNCDLKSARALFPSEQVGRQDLIFSHFSHLKGLGLHSSCLSPGNSLVVRESQ